MKLPVFTEDNFAIFKEPARIIIAGYSNSGKTKLCENIILKYTHSFQYILYCGVENHPLERHEVIGKKLKVSKEILNPFDYTDNVDNGEGLLLVLDDCFIEASESKYVTQAFTAGRHKHISIIFLTQNLFHSGKFSRSISLNCSHYILMRSRDMGQIETLGRQLFGKRRGSEFVDVYKRGLSFNKYGYLLVDLSPHTPEELQFRTNIVGEDPHEVVLQW